MAEQLYQLHLAKTADIPEVRNEKGEVQRVPMTVNLQGMSGRCVRYRAPLPVDLHAKLELEAAKMPGMKEASMIELRDMIVRLCLYEMVRAVSEPVQSILEVKPDGWIKLKANDFIDGTHRWGEFFSVQDTQLLERIYRDWHDLPMAAVEILTGKALPVASEA